MRHPFRQREAEEGERKAHTRVPFIKDELIASIVWDCSRRFYLFQWKDKPKSHWLFSLYICLFRFSLRSSFSLPPSSLTPRIVCDEWRSAKLFSI